MSKCDQPAAIKALQAAATDLRRVVTQNAALPSSPRAFENQLLAIGGRDAAWLSIRWVKPLLACDNSGLMPPLSPVSNRCLIDGDSEQCDDQMQSWCFISRRQMQLQRPSMLLVRGR